MNTDNYKNWLQTDPRFNKEEAWPADLFPKAQFHFFEEAGCLICSLAIMLRQHNIETEADEEIFNPWILNERLIEAKAFTPTADLIIDDINKLYPLEYAGIIPYSREGLIRLLEMGNPFLITVNGVRGDRHFVVPDQVTDEDIIIIDPAYGKRLLRDYTTVYELRVFRNENFHDESNPVIPAFNRDFTISGSGSEDIVQAVLAQMGKTGLDLGYDYDWCASFLSDLAVEVHQEKAIPWNALAIRLHTEILAAGGSVVTDNPRKGDIVFINWDGGGIPNHVEIICGTEGEMILTAGGNTNDDNFFLAIVSQRKFKEYIIDILRPAYETLK